MKWPVCVIIYRVNYLVVLVALWPHGLGSCAERESSAQMDRKQKSPCFCDCMCDLINKIAFRTRSFPGKSVDILVGQDLILYLLQE